jgi:hypothetical protein
VVSYIDRFAADGYAYHPLRQGQLIGHRTELDYLYLTIQLEDYISPRDPAKFREALLEQIGALGLAALTDQNPENPHDGYYAITSDSIFGQGENFQFGDEAWGVTVDRLSRTRALRTDEEQAPVFVQTSIRDGKNHTAQRATVRNGVGVFSLKKDARYDLVLTYRFPKQRLDHSFECGANLKLGDNLKALSDTRVVIDSYSNSITIPVTSKRYTEDNIGHIAIEPGSGGSGAFILLPDAAFEYALGESRTFWLQLILALLLYAAAGALIGVEHFASITWGRVLPKAGLAFLQALSIFWMLRFMGKKVV